MKVDFLSDEYIYALAGNDVVTWRGVGERVGYQIADVPAGQHASLFVPAAATKSLVSRFNLLSTVDRVLIQEYSTDGFTLSTRFRFIVSQQIIETYQNDVELILSEAKSWFRKWGIDIPIEFDQEESQHNAAYDPNKRVVLINPSTMYKHMSRSAVFSRIPMRIALYFVMAHEAGHTLCAELRSRYDEFLSMIKTLNALNRKGRFNTKLYSNYHELLMRFEQNAWDLGKQFVPSDLHSEYEHQSKVMINEHGQERAFYMIRSILSGEA
jgi:hypothetical protein